MTVNEILRNVYGWAADEEPDPEVVAEALLTRTAEDIAAALAACGAN